MIEYKFGENKEKTKLDDIYQVSKNRCWGYKGKIGPDQGWKYPNLGSKVKKIIIEYTRKRKLIEIQHSTL